MLNPFTSYIYLFFLHTYKGTTPRFYQMLFQFHRYVTIEKSQTWERLFWLEEQDSAAKDVDEQLILRTLLHHGCIDSSHTVTETGKKVLQQLNTKHATVHALLNEFVLSTKEKTFLLNDCFIDGYEFPVTCHLCQERICLTNRLTIRDFGRLFQFKGLKTPYKKRTHELPQL